MTETLIDTHTHSDRHWDKWPSENVQHSPTDLATEVALSQAMALEEGLSLEETLGGFVLSGHDTVDGVSEAMEAAEKYGIVAMPGVEITCKPSKKGFGPHIVVLLPMEEARQLEAKGKGRLRPTLRSVGYVIEWAHDQGGIAVAAHPLEKGGLTSLSHKKIKKHASAEKPERQIDGVETLFPLGLNHQRSLKKLVEIAREYGVAQYGSSDGHKTRDIGTIATKVSGLPENYTSDDVLEAMRLGQTEPVLLREPRGEVKKKGFRALIDSRKNVIDLVEERHLRELREFERNYERIAA